MKKNTPQDVNLNEYKIIKNTLDIEEGEILTEKTNSTSLKDKEIQEIQKEVINLHVEEDKDDEHADENIEDLKASILNHD
jgi:hypothetical protein